MCYLECLIIKMLEEATNPSKMTSAISTDDAEGVSKEQHWYVAIVTFRAEKAVRNNLARKGIEAYVAARKELHLWRREERKVIERVLIPSIVFVHVSDDERVSVLNEPNVRSFMVNPAGKKSPWGRNPLAVVPDVEMRLLQSMLAQNDLDVAFATSDFAVGDHVKILGLGTDDHLAQIVRIAGDDSTYVGVRIETLGCAYMKIPLTRIVKIADP